MTAARITTAYVALGANLGDPVATLHAAAQALAALPATRVTATSSLYRTAPVGLADQPDFINAVVQLETQLTPLQLMQALLQVEAEFGRQRSVRNAPRTLDLDVLLHGDTVSADPVVTLPHPRMHERAFVLAPLAEIAPHLSIPGHGPIAALLPGVADQGVRRL